MTVTKRLLREYFELCPDGNCVLDVLTESEKHRLQEGSVFLVGVCQKAGTKNGNGRIYPRDILEREVNNYQRAIQERRALGELDHPDDSVINLKNASHLVTKMWWSGDDVMGKIEILDTPSGRILKDLLKSDVKLGISSRGMGSVRESQGILEVEEDFQLICFDMVSEPSTPGAYMAPDSNQGLNFNVSNSMSEGTNKTPVGRDDKIHNIMDNILRGIN